MLNWILNLAPLASRSVLRVRRHLIRLGDEIGHGLQDGSYDVLI